MGDLGKLIVAKGFKKLPKVQKIAKSGHTGCELLTEAYSINLFSSIIYGQMAINYGRFLIYVKKYGQIYGRKLHFRY